MIHVVALITAKPGMREAVLAAFNANVPNVRAEAGCIEYGPAIDAPGVGAIQTKLGADSFAVIEKWESEAALAAHAKAPHMAAYAAKVGEMLASRVIHVLVPA
jgi:quinol monooxygenase YgiN